MISFLPPSGARSFFAVGAGRITIIGIGRALVGAIRIAASSYDMGMTSQPTDGLRVGKILEHVPDIAHDASGTLRI